MSHAPEDFRYMQRRIRDLERQVDPLRVALDYSMPILERARAGEWWWADEPSACEAVRLATKALTASGDAA